MRYNYAMYRLAHDLSKQQKALAKREAALAAQETPKEATAHEIKVWRAVIIASGITFFLGSVLSSRMNWSVMNGTASAVLLVIGAFVWWFFFKVLSPSRALSELVEYRREQARQGAERNEAIRQEKIGRGL